MAKRGITTDGASRRAHAARGSEFLDGNRCRVRARLVNMGHRCVTYIHSRSGRWGSFSPGAISIDTFRAPSGQSASDRIECWAAKPGIADISAAWLAKRLATC